MIINDNSNKDNIYKCKNHRQCHIKTTGRDKESHPVYLFFNCLL